MVLQGIKKHRNRYESTFVKAVSKSICQKTCSLTCYCIVYGRSDAFIRRLALRSIARGGDRPHGIKPRYRKGPRWICLPSRFGHVRGVPYTALLFALKGNILFLGSCCRAKSSWRVTWWWGTSLDWCFQASWRPTLFLGISNGRSQTCHPMVEFACKLDYRFALSPKMACQASWCCCEVFFGNLTGSLFFAAILVHCKLSFGSKYFWFFFFDIFYNPRQWHCLNRAIYHIY